MIVLNLNFLKCYDNYQKLQALLSGDLSLSSPPPQQKAIAPSTKRYTLCTVSNKTAPVTFKVTLPQTF